MPRYTLLIPVYNEEQSVDSTVEEVKSVASRLEGGCEIVFVDDCSSDGTYSKLEACEGITVIRHKRNRGYGAALKTGIKASNGEWIIITDADGTYPIEDIPKIAAHAGEYDMVVGARTGQNVNVPLLRRPAKWFLRQLAGYLARERIPDLNSGMRVFRREIAERFWNYFPNGFSFTSTITMAALVNNYDVKYVPIDYYRRTGKSGIHPLRDFIGFISLLFSLITCFKPLRIFVPAGLLLLIFGLAKGTETYLFGDSSITDEAIRNKSVGTIGVIPVMSVLGGIQIIFMGLLADLINKK